MVCPSSVGAEFEIRYATPLKTIWTEYENDSSKKLSIELILKETRSRVIDDRRAIS